ncbi:MAG TPA: polyprenol monophosphomannose synthase [Planctomycetaceae bacterium]|nr:polyprenol monophosphomannose synthase [Planctomycetaceae bacterium]
MLVTLCTYNERENIAALIPEIWTFAPTADILVIDDNSPDGTGQVADDWAARDSRMHVLHRPGKLGLGTATLAGFRFALQHDYDLLINLDADFSHHPRFIPALLVASDKADVTIGSRYVVGGGVVGWGLRRHFMSRAINWYARALLRLKTRDNSGAYRCYRVAKLRELDFGGFVSRGYAIQEEILYRCRRIGCRFAETPIVFEDRRHGASKINLGESIAAGWIILRLAIAGCFS